MRRVASFAAKAADVVVMSIRLPRRSPLYRQKAFDPGLGAGARLSEVAERTRLDRPKPRLSAPRYHDVVRGAQRPPEQLSCKIDYLPKPACARLSAASEFFTDDQLHLAAQKLSWSHINRVACALRFLYAVTVGQKEALCPVCTGRIAGMGPWPHFSPASRTTPRPYVFAPERHSPQ